LSSREASLAEEARSRLGRGLASLIGDVGGEQAKAERGKTQRRVPIEFLKPNPRNPRKSFVEAELEELAESIRQHGVIQPIVARPVRNAPDHFEIIAGERRWRAAQRAGLHDVPIVPVEVTDNDALQIMIVENIQREDLNAMEEARGYHLLVDEFRHSTDDVAKVVGKSRSHIANMMRLTKLPNDVQDLISSGKLSAGHARALIGVADPSQAAARVIEEGLSVRQTEALAHEAGVPTRKSKTSVGKARKDADTLALEKRMSDVLGLSVSVDHKDPGGTVQIKYRDLEQLDDIVLRLESGRG
jgi:ParB family transcriptional regulator, chromosome partitioning protein